MATGHQLTLMASRWPDHYSLPVRSYGVVPLLMALLGAGCQTPVPERGPASASATTPPIRVTLETTAGTIVLDLDSLRAPKSVANFLVLVRGRFYDGLVFHRVKPRFIVQAGYVTAGLVRRATNRPPIYNEADNGLKNVRGAVAMARGPFPQSATTEFFIDVADNAALDFRAPTDEAYGYAVFGHVLEGMSVVDAIASAPTTRRAEFADWPVRPVVIQRAYVSSANTQSIGR